MAGPRGARLQVGSSQWIAEERSSATQIAQSEVEEFSFSARNDFDWLNEHMADIFSENQINVAEVFKTPGKLRGKTPRTIRRPNPTENRVPLSNIFSATPKGPSNPFSMPSISRNITPRVKIAADSQLSHPKTTNPPSPLKQHVSSPKPAPAAQPISVVDSGYHGSQSQDVMEVDEPTQPFSPQQDILSDPVSADTSPAPQKTSSPAPQSPEHTAEAMEVEPTTTQFYTAHVEAESSSTKTVDINESTTPAGSPVQSPQSTAPSESFTPSKSPITSPSPANAEEEEQDEPELDAMEGVEEQARSPSDGSSPIRPIVRKSSLNFASLPAREPMTHKSIGNRISRVSHLDQNRTSYYHRHTGGKSLGHTRHELTDDENDDMDLDGDDDDEDDDQPPSPQKTQAEPSSDNAVTHNKTYTQRLQDQINKLGQKPAAAPRRSKSLSDSSTSQPPATTVPAPQPTPQAKPLPSPRKAATTPGAFPEDDEDDWIQPLGTPDNASAAFSPRPELPRSYTADVMEGVSGKNTISGGDFAVPQTQRPTSPTKSPQRPPVPEKPTGALGHHKSVSVPVLPIMNKGNDDENDLKKTISASNPTALESVPETERPSTPIKSPTRSLRDSPLKQIKNKVSSILKGSKGLLASSAALSAESKSSLVSPSTPRIGLPAAPSSDELRSPLGKDSQPLYPDLSRHMTETQTIASTTSPGRNEGRRTRASIEREKQKEKEAKEARRVAEQMEKLEKAREKEREKARVFSKEQERIAAMEKQMVSQKEQEKKPPVAPTPKTAPRTAQPSPKKAKSQPATEGRTVAYANSDDKTMGDVEMVDATISMPPPPSVARSIAPPSATKPREIKRPVRPAKETVSKAKQAPTVIRVNMGSQHSQYHPSNNTLSSNLHETLSQPQSKGKANHSLQAKPSLQSSMQSFKSSTSSVGRPKALEAAARRKEQEEREAQRKRDAKAEMERKRTAMQEEEKRQERQKEEERKQQAEAKKNAQRQAMIEKAKQTRAPPPAVRSQPNGPPDYSKTEPGSSRPPSRLATASNTVLSNGPKSAAKRPLQQDQGEDNASRQASARNGNAYQSKESKRLRMSDELDNMGEKGKPSLKGAPVRPSGGLKKDIPTKSMFPSGYTTATQNNTRDLFKSTVTGQHNSQAKVAHPLDLTQVSKSAIPFAPNPAGPSHKTPARPQGVAAAKSAAKSATRSSPRFQNGEAIELPEINTDDEDSDDEDAGGKDMVAAWADSPELRRALVEQESKDPFEVFGAPGPLNMEEVFAKSKDRFHKFRARTSSANWSGADRLTEEDIRKDLAARDKMRREGGWTYEMSRDMV